MRSTAAAQLGPSLLRRKIQRRLHSAGRSPGEPLPPELQRKFEGSLGADLGAVRVHTGAASAEAASAVQAHAYTVGNDVHFAAGQYDPASSAGEKLLAHEVAHTVQQGGAADAGAQLKLEVSAPGDASETAADHAAAAMVEGRPTTAGPRASGVQRFHAPSPSDVGDAVGNAVSQGANDAADVGNQVVDAAGAAAQSASAGPGVSALIALFAAGTPDPERVVDLIHQFPGERDAIIDYCRQHGGDALVAAVEDALANPTIPAAPGPLPVPYPSARAARTAAQQVAHGAKDAFATAANGAKDAAHRLGRGAHDAAANGAHADASRRSYDIVGGMVAVVGPPAIVTKPLATMVTARKVSRKGDVTTTHTVENVVGGSSQTHHGGFAVAGTVERTEKAGPHGTDTVVRFIGVTFTDPTVTAGPVPAIGGELVDAGHGTGLTIETRTG